MEQEFMSSIKAPTTTKQVRERELTNDELALVCGGATGGSQQHFTIKLVNTNISQPTFR
jgi:hypothetical protein